MSETLFDPDLYGPGRQPRRTTRERSTSLPVEPHTEPWAAIRQHGGVAPFFHLPRGRNGYNATVAMCGLTGTEITNAGVDQMIRCPVCVVALDMM